MVKNPSKPTSKHSKRFLITYQGMAWKYQNMYIRQAAS
jgi:hypothetical protein